MIYNRDTIGPLIEEQDPIPFFHITLGKYCVFVLGFILEDVTDTLFRTNLLTAIALNHCRCLSSCNMNWKNIHPHASFFLTSRYGPTQIMKILCQIKGAKHHLDAYGHSVVKWKPSYLLNFNLPKQFQLETLATTATT